jgi:hypothetical protein
VNISDKNDSLNNVEDSQEIMWHKSLFNKAE